MHRLRVRSHVVHWVLGFVLLHCMTIDAEHNLIIRIYDGTETVTLNGELITLRDPENLDRDLMKEMGFENLSHVDIDYRDALTFNKKKSDLRRVLVESETLQFQKHSYRKALLVVLTKKSNRTRLFVLHPLDIETYVIGTISSEIPPSWPLETYKAQAIATRTYAIKRKYARMNDLYHLDSTVLDQVYRGMKNENKTAREATLATSGLILSYDNLPIEAFFHSTCGGNTARNQDVFRTAAEPYLQGASCADCKHSTAYAWRISLTKTELARKLFEGRRPGLKKVEINKTDPSGRVTQFAITTYNGVRFLSGEEMRKRIGYMRLKSTKIHTVKNLDNSIVFEGNGFGHGVGLCQWGAHGMAIKGATYEEILARYYPDALVVKLY